MHIDVKIILKLMLKKGDIRKLTEIICHRSVAGKRIVGLQKVQFFFDWVDEYKVFTKDSAGWN
jgi:hypothetical protein